MAKSANVLKLSQSITEPDWLHTLPGTGAPIDVAGRILRNVLDIHSAAGGAIEMAGADSDLSEQGQVKAQKAAGRVQLGLLETLETEAVKVVSAAVAKARSKAKTDQSPDSLATAEGRAREIRDWIFREVGTDSLKLEIILRGAVERGDSETVDALLGGPQVWPLAQAFDRATLTAERAGMIDASLGEETVALVQAESDLMERIQWAKDGIIEDAGLNADDDGIVTLANADVGADAEETRTLFRELIERTKAND